MPGRPEPGGPQSLPERDALLWLSATACPTPAAPDGRLAAPLFLLAPLCAPAEPGGRGSPAGAAGVARRAGGAVGAGDA